MTDEEVKDAFRQMMRDVLGNTVMVELMDDGKFIVHLKVKDPSKREVLAEMGARCLDVVQSAGMGR
jgi:hypothetical protein